MKPIFCTTFISLLLAGHVLAAEIPFVELKGHTAWVDFAIFSPDGKKIATASRDDTARIWDVESGKELLTLPGAMDFIALSPDGTKMVTAGANHTAIVWDVESGKQLHTLQGNPNSRADVGNYFISLVSYDPMVRFADFSPDGKRVVTASNDGCVRIWTLE